jgi:4-hydroxy-tetrahydrodipicolinate reductase
MTAPRRLALIGLGKMGRALAQLAPERGWDVVATIGGAENRDARAITPSFLEGVDVAIEFTTPNAAPANVRAAVAAGCPIVVGTTGWYDQLAPITEFVSARNGALLTAPNFSIGVNAFEQIVKLAAKLLSGVGGFDGQLVETHHAAKKDAPSGTAIMLQRAAARGWQREMPITSVRTGSVPGTHELLFDAPFETVTLTHAARDRRVFAEGALVAAAWLIGRRGVFTMQDVLASRATPGAS